MARNKAAHLNTNVKSCKICMHEKRQEIELAILTGRPYEEIVDYFSTKDHKISISSLRRHYRNHWMPPTKDKVQSMISLGVLQIRDYHEDLLELIEKINSLIEQYESVDTDNFGEIDKKTNTLMKLYTLRSKTVDQYKKLIETVDSRTAGKITKDIGEALSKFGAQ